MTTSALTTTGSYEQVPVEADAEKPARELTGRLKAVISLVAVLLSLYAIWNVFNPVPALQYRIVFLAVVLPLTFLLYRPA
ncbi:MAG: C4-dicarboxylate ABC transporter permease, partial [Frankiales bacterium]|nr:C4-dicarboxylate ABC transporter permease [Frankiales bacterium]